MKLFIICSGFFLGIFSLNNFSSNNSNCLMTIKNNSTHFDTSINHEIFLINEKSILNSVGDMYHHLNKENESVLLFNTKGNEYLKMHHELGGGRNSYDRFEVGYAKEANKKKELSTKYEHFTTESGISLGMTKQEFLKRITNKKMKISYKNKVAVYEYSNKEWGYNAQYFIRGDTLINFCFGYETP